MESLVLLVILLVLVGPVLAIIALVRTGSLASLRKSVADLQQQVNDLQQRLRVLQRPPEVPAQAAAPPAAPAPMPRVAEPVTVGPTARPLPPPPPPPPPSPPLEVQPPIEPTEPPPPSRPSVDWERWIGIRGAALLGAIVLALAGLLFFQFSIQHGLITPPLRVVLGIATGLGCLVASEWLRPRGIRATPEGLAGAGIVILYAALYAGQALYGLIPLAVTFALMVLVTVACGLLAVRHASRFVAVLGLIGGFATPLLLHSDQDRPVGLFGYVLLLDLGLLAVGRRQRWPWLSLLALLGTALLQGLWMGARMGADRVVLGLVILGLFAAVFAASGRLGRGDDREEWLPAQVGGLLLPFGFTFYFASRIDLGPHFWPVLLFLLLLCAGASWVARSEGVPWLALAAAAGSLGVFAVWRLRAPFTTAAAWESVAAALALAALFHLFVELRREEPGLEGPAPAAMVAALGTGAVLLIASALAPVVSPWPWLAGWLGLSALLYRHAAFPEREALQLAAAVGTAVLLALEHGVHAHDAAFPPAATFLGAMAALAVAAQVAALLRRSAPVRAFADHAAAAFAAISVLALFNSPLLPDLGPGLALGGTLVLALLVLLAAARLPNALWGAGALLAVVLVHAVWTVRQQGSSETSEWAKPALLFQGLGVLAFTAWPFLSGRALRRQRVAWYVAALAGPLWFFPARVAWVTAFGRGALGLLPILLGAVALLAVARARRALREEEPGIRLTALVWLTAVAICFTSVAIPLQLEKSWITIGWALEGVALLALWRRLDHPGLKWFALALLAAATLRLVPLEALLGSYPRSSVPILNWVLYTYLVPAAALFASAWLLRPLERERARDWEHTLYDRGLPVGALGAAVAGIFVVFVWINLAIADWFAEGPRLTLDFGRSPARDLTVSIAWAVYAMVLLGFGMARASSGLRWLSLGFLVVTIGKVFLYDVGELRDLYRIMSLVGLAVSLLSVSLLYQRFVFRRLPPETP
ncbi:MAG TPA: DUF2339 domain-containing protein [Candidatus Polarisedimenticolaceae bacterium]|nr:DUF2339 domain-containing protein [Candidatus Polarisedimenticolaceae bacterium]